MSEETEAPETGAESTETDETQHSTDEQPIQLPDDHPLVRTLAAQKDQIKELREKAKRLDEIEDSQKTEAERASDQLAEATQRAEAAETALIQRDVAMEKGVPAKALKFLTGTTREEIEASADEVLGLIGEAGKPRSPQPDPNQGRTDQGARTVEDQFAAFTSNLP